MPTDGKLSGREIKELFFTEVETADGVTQFRCRCGKIRAQSLKHGYTNLSQHVLVKHEDWYSAAVRNANVVPAPSAAGQLNGGRKSPAKSRSQSPSANSDERVAAPSPPTERTDTAIDEEEKQEETTQEATPVVTPATDEANDGTKKRADYLSWDDYFMSVAFLSAMRSKGEAMVLLIWVCLWHQLTSNAMVVRRSVNASRRLVRTHCSFPIHIRCCIDRAAV